MTHSCLNFLNLGTASSERRIAIRRDEGAGPGLFWLGGFKSDMKGTKAQALSDWARQNGRACVRFDYSGHGESSGDFLEVGVGAFSGLRIRLLTSYCAAQLPTKIRRGDPWSNNP